MPDSPATITPIFDQLVEEFRGQDEPPAGSGQQPAPEDDPSKTAPAPTPPD
ncbi:hypothetical protein [Actinophytocola algeriensis]|uniref:Uncharacterized protein n=1 Tax=Actinophytocola algeriensis TaxID=1768010 RepID=A0A7W7VDA6_9PSEU|nr:hypothetical protein [Actinophytocola algeriensis]MBB4905894.1 hypothetical protein [Actinophytocola algeriensis]MBE1472421.1 hypothetical protein [Actinophytocola algeriensis]